MNQQIVKNNESPVGERMPLEGLPGDYIQCEGCLRIHAKNLLAAEGFICHDCGDMVCAICGCTDSVACDEGCSWVAPGLCSTHEEQ